MTKREMFQRVIDVVAVADVEDADVLVESLKHEIELLDGRKSNKGLTKTQKANEGIMEQILLDLEEFGKPVTVTELNRGGEGLADYTPQKISALLKKLVDGGKVVKTIEGKKAGVSIA